MNKKVIMCVAVIGFMVGSCSMWGMAFEALSLKDRLVAFENDPSSTVPEQQKQYIEALGKAKGDIKDIVIYLIEKKEFDLNNIFHPTVQYAKLMETLDKQFEMTLGGVTKEYTPLQYAIALLKHSTGQEKQNTIEKIAILLYEGASLEALSSEDKKTADTIKAVSFYGGNLWFLDSIVDQIQLIFRFLIPDEISKLKSDFPKIIAVLLDYGADDYDAALSEIDKIKDFSPELYNSPEVQDAIQLINDYKTHEKTPTHSMSLSEEEEREPVTRKDIEQIIQERGGLKGFISEASKGLVSYLEEAQRLIEGVQFLLEHGITQGLNEALSIFLSIPNPSQEVRDIIQLLQNYKSGQQIPIDPIADALQKFAQSLQNLSGAITQ